MAIGSVLSSNSSCIIPQTWQKIADTDFFILAIFLIFPQTWQKIADNDEDVDYAARISSVTSDPQ